MPIVYNLTNESMPDTIKIGITDNLERRIKECYYAVEVENANAIEKKIHTGLDDKRINRTENFLTQLLKVQKQFWR